MEGKSVLRASVSGTVTPKDEKDPEVSYQYFLYLYRASYHCVREYGNKLMQLFLKCFCCWRAVLDVYNGGLQIKHNTKGKSCKTFNTKEKQIWFVVVL